MSHEAGARRSSKSNSSPEDQPAHAGRGHLVGNLVWFVLVFGAFLVGVYLISWFTPQNVWPMVLIVVIAFLVFFIPQGLLGRADTGYNLAAGKQTDEKETSAGVSS